MADDANKPESGQTRKRRGRHPEKALNAPTVRNATPGRHADGNGLYLHVDDSGARRWVLRTTVHGRRRDIGLGGASLVSLAEAREKARALRKIAREGGDPVAERDKDKRTSLTFADAAKRVHAEQVKPSSRNEKAAAQWLSSLEAYAFPTMGTRPVHAVEQADVLRVLAPIWTEKPETARRVRQRLRTVLDWARTAGHREGINPVEGVEKGLPKQRARVQHFAALPWQDLPDLWPRLERARGMGGKALRFCILTAARSGEVRAATWSEIDLEAGVWTVPAEKMKAEREHRVPLSEPALAVLREVRPLRAKSEALVFPSGKKGKALSDMTLASVLKRLEVPVTVHGFRSTFRDWAEEATSYPHEVKEAALAHAVKGKTERAYRRSDLFEKRCKMMNEWGGFVVRAGGAADDDES
ncbi:MAG: tyrosine-type recombinase/integrase [Pseudomonadota bacterium]